MPILYVVPKTHLQVMGEEYKDISNQYFGSKNLKLTEVLITKEISKMGRLSLYRKSISITVKKL